MTLHWWMHWFWVTLQLAGLLANPLPSTTQDPRIQENGNPATRIVDADSRGTATNGTLSYLQSIKLRTVLPTTGTGMRIAKAISSYDDSPSKAGNPNRNAGNEKDESREVEITTRRVFWENSTGNRSEIAKNRVGNVAKRDDPNAIYAATPKTTPSDSQITWLLTTSKTPERRKKKNESFTAKPEVLRNLSSKAREPEVDEERKKDLTVLPLRIESGTRLKIVVNSTRTITSESEDGFSSTRTFNGSEDIEIDQELAEPRLSATAASILQDFLTAGISESTRLSRARNAFSSDLQRDGNGHDRVDFSQVILEANESVNSEDETLPSSSSSSPSVVDIAAIGGSCLATIVLLSTMASLGFIMYRRRYLNPPQTLNSDKCSNPDSSGYIDDSTIRDNSEEMYSLDNDSFLNSLEAMTIQNYWTDSVKHTKL